MSLKFIDVKVGTIIRFNNDRWCGFFRGRKVKIIALDYADEKFTIDLRHLSYPFVCLKHFEKVEDYKPFLPEWL